MTLSMNLAMGDSKPICLSHLSGFVGQENVVKKIKFFEHNCMCEKNEFDEPLECFPFRCEIMFCPIKQLIFIVQSSEQTSRDLDGGRTDEI